MLIGRSTYSCRPQIRKSKGQWRPLSSVLRPISISRELPLTLHFRCSRECPWKCNENRRLPKLIEAAFFFTHLDDIFALTCSNHNHTTRTDTVSHLSSLLYTGSLTTKTRWRQCIVRRCHHGIANLRGQNYTTASQYETKNTTFFRNKFSVATQVMSWSKRHVKAFMYSWASDGHCERYISR